MTKMSVVDVVNIVYPGQFDLGNIAFGQDGNNPIFITKWTVPDVPKPSMESLLDKIPELQAQFDLMYFTTAGQAQLAQYLDSVAQQRQYDSAVSCASYIMSTIPQWKSEASVFIDWRDSIFVYTLEQVSLMESGQRTVPTFQEFQTELPVITWPEL